MKNEKTSKRVAEIAGRVLQDTHANRRKRLNAWIAGNPICTISELRSLAASCLTQAADKKAGKK